MPQDRIMIRTLPFLPPRMDPMRHRLHSDPTHDEYILAARIRSKGEPDREKDDGASETEQSPAKSGGISVVLVADIDMLTPAFFAIRAEGERPGTDVHFEFDNVTFILNVLDSLAGEERFMEIRKRRRIHRTLTRIEEQTEKAKEDATRAREGFIEEFDKGQQREQEAFDKKIKDLEGRENVDPQQMLIAVALARQAGQRRLTVETERLERERDTAVNKIETELALKIRSVQDSYKRWAVLFPPILPLVLALIVFVYRRVHESEGVAQTRLR